MKDGYKAVNKDGEKLKDISRSIIKLYDHTNLEIARINYTKSLNNNVKSDLAQAKLLTQKLITVLSHVESAELFRFFPVLSTFLRYPQNSVNTANYT